MARSYSCTGQGDNGDHCCYLGGKVCPHLVENRGGRRYACGLMLKYGDWAAMRASDEYRFIGGYWMGRGKPFNYCETFDPAFCCRPEFRAGRRYEGQVL
jgi:hypothetical protein